MKYIYYGVIFMFLSVMAQAQRSITYVAFFPANRVVHNDVSLKQNTDSFSIQKIGTYDGNTDYSAMAGSLILGAAPDAEINIEEVKISSGTAARMFTIQNFNVDNIINVVSTGTISYIELGSDSYCSNGNQECNNNLIYADSIAWPLHVLTVPDGLKMHIRSSETTYTTVVRIKKDSNSAPRDFIPGLQAGDKLYWIQMRINGTEECRYYLVKRQSDPPLVNFPLCRPPD